MGTPHSDIRRGYSGSFLALCLILRRDVFAAQGLSFHFGRKIQIITSVNEALKNASFCFMGNCRVWAVAVCVSGGPLKNMPVTNCLRRKCADMSASISRISYPFVGLRFFTSEVVNFLVFGQSVARRKFTNRTHAYTTPITTNRPQTEKSPIVLNISIW